MLGLEEWKEFIKDHNECLAAPIGIVKEQFGCDFESIKRGKEEVEDNRV